ncbi:MAG: zinc ribbon domain-containing protein [Chloroflexi bacterium]|nr:zinc ribbon domain-containing protein [Chloroflexota bacterium]MBM3173640.1 zinc ribbon domain-containing protein [Chloroflexota bacterium]MBM3175996.1 zinc ribbon domain-containing protein [Chloroflexota bacterium]MBM4449789.1 zinc ribbon domain-containing protein [Chloroflexota bacterium]
MPVYEYYCPQCEYKFELLRPISKADGDAACTRCNRPSKRVLSRFASFSKDSSGESAPIAGTGSSCSGCNATSCSTCH